ncbi:MAG: hypothetical protein AB1689_10425 [Thermodesulfobacteriota bacterium]
MTARSRHAWLAAVPRLLLGTVFVLSGVNGFLHWGPAREGHRADRRLARLTIIASPVAHRRDYDLLGFQP